MSLTTSVTLISDSTTPCGVESFARHVATKLNNAVATRHETFTITAQPGEVDVLRRTMTNREALIVHLPVVGWKKRIIAPARYMLAARRLGKEVILVLHEWTDLDWKRRATYLGYVPLATRILFSSPIVRDQFAADPISRLGTQKRGLVPIPPNLKRPSSLSETTLTAQLAAIKSDGKLLLGHFGSIYPKKQSTVVLDIAAALKAKGKPVQAVFVGSFISGGVDPAAAFYSRVKELGLEHDVTVTGYIGLATDVFAALEACDLFVYSLAEGLTSRRSSVLTCLQSGRPVMVNAPTSKDEFLHHPTFTDALSAGGLTLLATDARPADFAEVIIDSAGRDNSFRLDFDRAWADVIAAI